MMRKRDPQRSMVSRRMIPLLREPFFQVSAAVMVAVFLLGSIGVAALGREIHPEGTLPPGIRVAGADIGEMEQSEARALLENRLEGYSSNPLEITYENRSWQPSLHDLGGSFNIDGTLRSAMDEKTRWERMRIRLFGADTTIVPLQLSLDEAKLTEYVSSIAADVNQEPEVPRLTMRDGELMMAAAQNGFEVIESDLVELIRDQLFALDRTPVTVATTEIEPEFTDADVSAVSGMIRSALGGPLTIRFEDRSWSVEPDQLADFLTLERNDDGEFGLGFHRDELLGFLGELIGDINRPAQNATVAWGGSGVVATSPSQNGIERDLDAMIPVLQAAIAEGQREVELTYNVTRPRIDSNNLEELGVTTLMAQGESAFWNSSPSRAHNIAVSANYLDGTLIPPGTEFSFNQAIGEISIERGYQEGYVILAEATAEGVGGGVCQVSTTMFRAAFFSGLPITERNPHSYIVGFYEAGGWPLGFDAAIYQPHTDFRFMNSTDSYILVHTHIVDGVIYINLYGPDLGYSVEMGEAVIQNETAPPADVEVLDASLAPGARQQVEWAKPGMEVTLPRTVTNRDGEVVRRDYFYSNFQAWGNRFLVGPSPEQPSVTVEEAPRPEPPSGEIIEETNSDSESSN